MVAIHEPDSEYDRLIHFDENKNVQIHLTVNTFRGVEYLHLRKYYLDFEGEWLPTPEGVAVPIDLSNLRELFVGLTEILALAESRQIIEDNFGDLIRNLCLK